MKINDLLGSKQRKQLRRIAHHLRPVVTIADLEITDGVSNEVVRALTDHELIKIKIDISEKAKDKTWRHEFLILSRQPLYKQLGSA